MANLKGVSIHITGIVQGVGFRPFVYGLATRYGLSGWVRNTSSGVDIEADGVSAALKNFLNALQTELPPLARIDTQDISYRNPNGYVGFTIIRSEAMAGAFQPISPDVSICEDCLHELFDPSNRRFRYPFINCTNCGPRFTIISDIPYDRPNTTMASFKMCSDCATEYHNPDDRRFHAQPVACPLCGPKVWLEYAKDKVSERSADFDDAIIEAQNLLRLGKILAIKGLGGFHLACDATNPDAVGELRHRKLRVDKPFALMMPNLAAVERHCYVSDDDRILLESYSRPIVLLPRKADSNIAIQVAPKQYTLGVMLPYTPLHYLLFAEPNHQQLAFNLPPLVMTSGNLSEEPIAIDNEDALHQLASLADAFLMHNRDIRIRCDDSVVRVTRFIGVNSQPSVSNRKFTIVLRRSRGYAPDPILLPFDVPSILATGPELKNTFCLTRGRYAFLSHHIGDMQNYETLCSFEEGVKHFERLFRVKPEAIAYDLHPDYLSTRYALQRGEQESIPLIGIQHHYAHIASCMADHNLRGDYPVIGLAFDGTGYGSDKKIWGGEFLVADYRSYRRPYHLAYFPLPGGEVAIKCPARVALALLWRLEMKWENWLAPVIELCAEERTTLQIQLERGLNTPYTSSQGRLFDAVAALVGLRQTINYEAQAAIELEAAADPSEKGYYPFSLGEETVELDLLVRALLADIRSGTSISTISARFHNGVVEMTRQACDEIRRSSGINEVALSGGVWQNMFLLERAVSSLQSDGFNVLIHHRVPTNDGGISLGQALIAANKIQSGS